jgi:Cu2+-exporting ATPase/Cu+-exporting ATPase
MFWAFIYNIIGMGLAITGHLNPIFAALAMVLSSVFVIGNSLRVKIS